MPYIDRIRNLGSVHDPSGIEDVGVVVGDDRRSSGRVAEDESVQVGVDDIEFTVLVPALVEGHLRVLGKE